MEKLPLACEEIFEHNCYRGAPGVKGETTTGVAGGPNKIAKYPFRVSVGVRVGFRVLKLQPFAV